MGIRDEPLTPGAPHTVRHTAHPAGRCLLAPPGVASLLGLLVEVNLPAETWLGIGRGLGTGAGVQSEGLVGVS